MQRCGSKEDEISIFRYRKCNVLSTTTDDNLIP